jgi:hypothetical protein
MSKQPPSPPSRLSEADPEFLRLSLCYLEGELSAEGVEKLQAHVRADLGKQAAFVRLCLTGSALIEAMSEGVASGTGPGGDQTKLDAQTEWPQSNDLNESMVLPAITTEDESDEVELMTPPPPVVMPQAQPVPLLRRRWLWAASIMIPLLAGAVIYRLTARPPRTTTVVSNADVQESFATVASSVDAQWGDANGPLQAGQRLPGIPLFLQSGVAEIKFDSGATMIVEAPARFQVQAANSVELTSGQISAKVPPGAHGFAVDTATTRVVDLGTEFGVAISPNGADEIEVFKGTVRAEPQAAGPAGSVAPLLLGEGQAAVSTGHEIKLDPAGAQPQKFVRQLGGEPAALDLVDLIAGGDGTTHRRGIAIDYQKHAMGIFAPTGSIDGDHQYHRVGGSSVVDGCFVPDGSNGPVEVNSIGQTHVFPSTENHVYDQIWTGGRIPGLSKYGSIPTALGGIDYSAAEHSILFMNSNGGMTIDLAAIQRLHPAYLLKRLQCIVGNSDVGTITALADAYVLLGDKVIFEQRKFDNRHAPFTVDVPLDPADRFLTFAVTDGGDGIPHDAILWADPKLIGEAR